MLEHLSSEEKHVLQELKKILENRLGSQLIKIALFESLLPLQETKAPQGIAEFLLFWPGEIMYNAVFVSNCR